MRDIIKVSNFKECIPKKGVWYSLHGIVFVSVLLKSKPHVRRKSAPLDNKKDHDLSEWHRRWQYDLIESNFGGNDKRTFEISIKVNHETHRIDSLIDKIAIEFQHTLSVSIDEINSRYHAHKIYGFTPYLVLDYKLFLLEDLKSILQNNSKDSLNKNLNKWLTSEYAKSNNLFLDLKDGMVRITKSIEPGYLTLTESYFVENLLLLESQLQEELILENERKKQLTILKEESELKAKNRAIEREKQWFFHEKLDNPDYRFFRFCFARDEIKPFLQSQNNEVFLYRYDSDEESAYLEEYHHYSAKYSNFEIVYQVISIKTINEIFTNFGTKFKSSTKIDHSIISIKKNHGVIAKFLRKGNDLTLLKEDKLPF